MNMWDDHVTFLFIYTFGEMKLICLFFLLAQDIIDGYGSYPVDMQNADCFKGL